MSSSTSTEASADTSMPGGPLVNSNSLETPNLPAPSGVVSLDTNSASETLASQLIELATTGEISATAAPMEGVETNGNGDEQVEEVLEEVVEEVVEEAVEEEHARRPPPPLSAKKGGKKGWNKGGKGKEKAVDQDAAAADEDYGTPMESDHEEDTSDDAFMRKRAEAMEALTKIEIQFAKLRDLLYVERMAEVEKDRIGVETGTHPELIHLTQLIELRRNKKLELAKKWLDGLEGAFQRQYITDEHALWNWWQNRRADLRTEMLDEAHSKRRKLEREKRFLERPKDDTLAGLLAPRPPPHVPLHHRRRLGFDGEALVENEIAWALRHPDVRADASVSGLDDETVYGDLERMGLRESIRHPGLYSYDPLYGPPPGMPAFADPRAAAAAQIPPGYPYAAYDPAAVAMQSRAFAAPPFGALPPLPSRADQPPSRPPSNPRLANFPAELGGGQPGYDAAAPPRTYAGALYPPPYGELEAERLHIQQPQGWPGKHSHAYGFDEETRRRTISANGVLSGSDSLDAVVGQRQSGGADDSAARPIENGGGGRTTPVGGSNPKARLTLDDHMSTRSPKSTASGAKASERSQSGRSSPGFMSIPTIPPFDRHRHEMAVAAARNNTPHSPALPSFAKTAQSLYSQAPAQTPSQQAPEQAQFPQYAMAGAAAAAAQRAAEVVEDKRTLYPISPLS